MTASVDLFCKGCRLIRKIAKAVQGLFSQWDCEVEPVYLIDGFLPNII